MKIRSDFVSNSSSSSFVVIADNGTTEDLEWFKSRYKADEAWNAYEFPSRDRNSKFGWEACQYYTVMTKLNFIGVQLLDLMVQRLNIMIKPKRKSYASAYLGRLDEYVKRVERVLKNLGINARFNSDCIRYHWAVNQFFVEDVYIDHKSSVVEDRNMEMLESDEALTNFLTYDESYIQGGNDNV